MALGQIGDGHSRRPHLGREIGLKAVCDAADLGHTGQTGDSGADEHHGQHVALHRDSGVLGHPGIGADELDLIPPLGLGQNEPENQRNDHADHHPSVDARAEEGGHLPDPGEFFRSRESKARGILPGPLDQPGNEQGAHVV